MKKREKKSLLRKNESERREEAYFEKEKAIKNKIIGINFYFEKDGHILIKRTTFSKLSKYG